MVHDDDNEKLNSIELNPLPLSPSFSAAALWRASPEKASQLIEKLLEKEERREREIKEEKEAAKRTFLDSIKEEKNALSGKHKYYSTMTRRCRGREKLLNILVAIVSSSAVATWLFSQNLEAVWQVLSLIAALAAVINTFLAFYNQVIEMDAILQKLNLLECDYNSLALQIEFYKLDDSQVIVEIDKLRRKEKEILSKEVRLPYDRKLWEKYVLCQEDKD